MDIGFIIMWVLLIGFGILLVLFRNKIKTNEKTIALIIGILLVISRIWRGSGYIMDQQWDRVIPLQLCSLSTYIALFYFLLGNKKLEKYLFFFGFLGLTSFIDPDVTWSEARYSYIFGFVFDHLIITLAPLYLIMIKDYKYDFKQITVPYLMVIILLFISWPITYLWEGSNFFYIIEKPVFTDLFNRTAFNARLYDLLYIFAFQFAFFVFNFVSFGLLYGVRKLVKEEKVTYFKN